jgi:hypothetical protein
VWLCPGCGSNNELERCWRCQAARPADAPEVPRGAPGTQPPTTWFTAAPPPATAPPGPRRTWLILAAAGVAAALLFVVMLTTVHPVFHVGSIGSPTVALAAPAAIDGLPKTDDYSSQPITVLGQHVLDVASATYGSGDVHYAVVAISGVSGGNAQRVLLDTLTPKIAGDDTADPTSTQHLARSGVDYTCERMDGAAPGMTCTWNADNVTGVVVQVGSSDAGRCADFADLARQAVRGR